VLFGKVNPAGRTNQTWVRDILDLPHILDYNIRNGRTYMYFKGEVLYPFGYGLSYTKFNYGEARVQKQDKQKIYVSVPVTNAGDRDGDEVVQLYVNYPDSKVEHPKRQLKAFERVTIPAGKTVEVILEVSKSDLTYWDEARHAFIPETGRIKFEIGASSADIRKVINFDAK
jgi:beta-glucosidase